MKIIDLKKTLNSLVRDKGWETIVVVFAVFLLGLFIANSYIFWRLEREISEPINVELKAETLKRDLLKQVLDNLEKREQYFNEGLLSKPDISDPSL